MLGRRSSQLHQARLQAAPAARTPGRCSTSTGPFGERRPNPSTRPHPPFARHLFCLSTHEPGPSRVVTIDLTRPRVLFSGTRLVEVDLPVGTRVMYPKPPKGSPTRARRCAARSTTRWAGPLRMLKPGMKVTSPSMTSRCRCRPCGVQTPGRWSSRPCSSTSTTTPSKTSTSSSPPPSTAP